MTQRSILAALPLLVLAVLWGCENDTSNDVAGPGGGTDKSCLGCHSSEDALKEILGTEKVVVAIGNKDDG
jgi:nitrate/TMAO reductase-like tetraheme cytochrome c subunit